MTSAATKAEMIERILSTAKQAATVAGKVPGRDLYAEFQAKAADCLISLAFKSEGELVSICRKIGIMR